MPVSDKLASAESSQYVMGEKRDGGVQAGWVPQLQLFPSHVPGSTKRVANFCNISFSSGKKCNPKLC